MTPRRIPPQRKSQRFLHDVETQLQGRLIEPLPSELEQADAEVIRHASALHRAVQVALSLSDAPAGGDWTSYSPAARRRGMLVAVASTCRGIVAQLAGDEPTLDSEGLPF